VEELTDRKALIYCWGTVRRCKERARKEWKRYSI